MAPTLAASDAADLSRMNKEQSSSLWLLPQPQPQLLRQNAGGRHNLGGPRCRSPLAYGGARDVAGGQEEDTRSVDGWFLWDWGYWCSCRRHARMPGPSDASDGVTGGMRGMPECQGQPVWGELDGNPGRRPKGPRVTRIGVGRKCRLESLSGLTRKSSTWPM